MSRELDQEVVEIGKWFAYHKREATDPDKRLEFLEKTCENLIWALARAVKDIQVLEGRRMFEDNNPLRLQLLQGIRLQDGIRARGS